MTLPVQMVAASILRLIAVPTTVQPSTWEAAQLALTLVQES
jgi:hypothetical protein